MSIRENFRDENTCDNGKNLPNRRNNPSDNGPVPTYVELITLARAAGKDKNPDIKALIEYAVETGDPRELRDLAEYLNCCVFEAMLNPDPFESSISPEEAGGELELGLVRNRDCDIIPFGLRLNEIIRNVLLFGLTGSGKTTTAKKILSSLLSTTVKMMVFDSKGDFLNFPSLFPGVEIWKFKLPSPDFRWNPLEPSLGNWKKHIDSFVPVFADSLGFYGGQTTECFIYEMLLQLGHKYNVHRGVFPSMLDLLDFLKKKELDQEFKRGSEIYRSFERFLNRVKSMVFAFEETFNCSTGYDLDQFLNHHVIFDITDLKEDARSFFVELFIHQAIRWRMEKRITGGKILNLVSFDEAKNFLPAYREEKGTMANMSKLIALSREFGFGYLVSECDPSLLSHSIKAESCVRLCFNLTEGKDIAAAARSLALNPEQTKEIQALNTGQAIVRLAGRIDEPFVIQVTK